MKIINEKAYYSEEELFNIANQQFNEGLDIGHKEIKDHILIAISERYSMLESENLNLMIDLLSFLNGKIEAIPTQKHYIVGDVINPPLNRSSSKDIINKYVTKENN